MFTKWRTQQRQKRIEAKINTIKEFKGILSRCDFGSFECILFTKAIKMLTENQPPKAVRKWVGCMEKQWNKF
jgi:hypothetical protein